MKIALDIHGVIDTNPEFFSQLTNLFMFTNVECAWQKDYKEKEVHILTGSRLTDGKIPELLRSYGIYYTHIFSIADYLKEHGKKELPQSTPENPWFCKEEWDMVKADYCRRHEIDLCLDDCDAYFEHFTTPIARYYSKDK